MAYQCKSCDQRFMQRSMLDQHTCTVIDLSEDDYTCDVCKASFDSKDGLLKHECKNKTVAVATSATPSLPKCKYCDAQFTNPNTLRAHEGIHTGNMPYKCTECGEKFPYHSNLRSHMRIHNDPVDRPHKCSKCGAKFSQLANLYAHERTHAADRTTTCENCNGMIPENCTHVCPKDGGEPFFKCIECGARFMVKHTLEVHMRTHTGERPYKCPQCNERFVQPGALQSHLRTHTTNLNHPCGECDQRFASEERLLEHVRTHAEITLRKCPVCQAAFANESRLLVHMEKHIASEKPCKCKHCPKSFGTDGELESHVKSDHADADIPKFKCPKCPNSFMTYMLLQNHARDTHPSSSAPFPSADFRCDDCGSKYTTQNRLIAHRRVKHPEKSKTAPRFADSSSVGTASCKSEITLISDEQKQKQNQSDWDTATPIRIVGTESLANTDQVSVKTEDGEKQNELSSKPTSPICIVKTESLANFEDGQNQNELLSKPKSPMCIVKTESLANKDHDSETTEDGQNQNELASKPKSLNEKQKRKRHGSEQGPKTQKRASKSKKNQTFICKECEESFDNQYLLHIHERVHEYEKGCNRCGGVRCTCQEDNVLRFSKRGRKPSIYRCSKCKRKCAGRKGLRDHKCSDVPSGNDGNGDDKTHHKKVHKNRVKDSTQVLPNIKVQKCPECDIRFTRRQLVELHLFTVHRMTFRDCSVCHEPFSHPVQDGGAPKDQCYICPKCDNCNKDNETCDTVAGVKSESNEGIIETKVPIQEPSHAVEKLPVDSVAPVIDNGSTIVKQEVTSIELLPSVKAEQKVNEPFEVAAPLKEENSGGDGVDFITDEGYDDFGDIADETNHSDNADDSEVEIVGFSGHFAGKMSTETIASSYGVNANAGKSIPNNTANGSLLSQLVPKLIQILALNVEGTDLKDFGWPTASSLELIERVIIKFKGKPSKNLGTLYDTLAANCKELIILSIGSADAEKLLEGQTIEKVIADVIATAERES